MYSTEERGLQRNFFFQKLVENYSPRIDNTQLYLATNLCHHCKQRYQTYLMIFSVMMNSAKLTMSLGKWQMRKTMTIQTRTTDKFISLCWQGLFFLCDRRWAFLKQMNCQLISLLLRNILFITWKHSSVALVLSYLIFL